MEMANLSPPMYWMQALRFNGRLLIGLQHQEEKSHIEVFLRPLSQGASALVFFSRRTDMPFVYNTSLAKLHFPEDTVYEVQDVYSGKTISGLKTGDSFSVVIDPSGVVMWYLILEASNIAPKPEEP
ncbi:hypothetical protein Q9966_002194 [Columba livia]|nr:hypothetical protein Q9966_002194 [Columba livia]